MRRVAIALLLGGCTIAGCRARSAAPPPPAVAAPAASSTGPMDEGPAKRWLEQAIVGTWVGTVQGAPYLIARVRLEVGANGLYSLSGEQVEPPTDRVICPHASLPISFDAPGETPFGVSMLAFEKLAADGSAILRAAQFYDLSLYADRELSGVCLTPKADAMMFSVRSRAQYWPGTALFRLRREGPAPHLPERPQGLATCPTDEVNAAEPQLAGCKTLPSFDDPVLRDYPEGIALAVPFRHIPVGEQIKIGTYRLDASMDSESLRAETLEGACKVRLDMIAESPEQGACTVRVWGVDQSLTRKSSALLNLHFHAREQGGPRIDRSELQKLYQQGLVAAQHGPKCNEPLAAAGDHVYRNVLTIKLSANTGVQVRRGKFVLTRESLDGTSEAESFRQLQATLARARRHAAIKHPDECAIEVRRVASELTLGKRMPDLRYLKLFVDVPDRAALTQLGRLLQSNPIIECLAYTPLPSELPGPGAPAPRGRAALDPNAPARWPTPQELVLNDSDTDCGGATVLRTRRPPGAVPRLD